MTVLIDPPAWPAHGRWWSHLASDTSFDELHAFAAGAGVPPRGFEGDHYDVPEEHYEALVAAGAVPVASRELLRRLVAAGLRRPKRAGERVVASVATADGRVDVVTSARPPRGRVDAFVLLLTDATDPGLLAVDADGHPPRIPVADPSAGWDGAGPRHTALAPGPVRQLGHLRRAADPPRWEEVEVVLHGALALGADVGLERRPVDEVVAARPLLAPLVDGPFSRFPRA